MAKKGFGLALVAGIGALAIASSAGASSSGPSRPKPVPPPPGPSTPPGPDEEVPPYILQRIANAVLSNDPAAMRAEAAKLRAEGYTAQAANLDALADELEAKTKAPPDKPPPAPKPSTPAKTPPRDLVRGMKGEDVREWQNQLRRDGYGNVLADGDFGTLTFEATREWQWERELVDDGIVGAKSRAAIGTAPKRTRAPVVVPPPPPAATKPPATPTPAPTQPKPPTPAPTPPAPANVPKPPTPAKPKTPAAPAQGTVPAALVNVTLRKSPPPEPFDQRVVLWQDRLKALGHRGAATKSDGMFGPNTETQTKALQKAKGLAQTGIADPTTINAAYGVAPPKAAPAPAPSPPVTPLNINVATWRSNMVLGNKGTDVREWQQVLNKYGFVVTADGDFGNLTKAATIAWQTAYARLTGSAVVLTPDGAVGKNTRARLLELETPKQIVAGAEGLHLHEVLSPALPVGLLPIFQIDQDTGSESVAVLARLVMENLEATAPGEEARGLIERFQRALGLNASGNYGPATAEALIPYGYVPPRPRVWPTKKLWRAQHRYKVALREQASKDPERASEWLSAANAF